jgi:hypothetical protein
LESCVRNRTLKNVGNPKLRMNNAFE